MAPAEAPQVIEDVPQTRPDRARRSVGLPFGTWAEAYALVALTLGLILLFSVLPASSGTFPTSGNFQILFADQAVLLVVALAVLVPLVTNTYDFTPGAAMGMTSIIAASVVSSSGSLPLAILAALGTGIAVGVLNGFLVAQLRINSVIATLGMTIIIAGVVQWKTNGKSIVTGIPESITNFGTGETLGVPRIAWVALAISLVCFYLLSRTVFGRNLYAIGSNRSAARLVGLRNERYVFMTYLISGALSGAGGVLQLARSGAGNPQVGPGLILPAYAAVFLGATSISPGRWNVWGVVIAVVFLGVLNSGLTLAGANTYVNSLVNGVALFIGVGIANLLARRRGKAPEMA